MIPVKIPAWMKTRAKELANKQIKALEGTTLKSRFNTDLFTNTYQGYLGELIFSHYLIELCIDFTWDKSYGQADESDFLVNGKTIDVKTGLRKLPMKDLNPETFKLLLIERQLTEHPSDLYFFILLEGESPDKATTAWLAGFISLEKAKNWKDKVEINAKDVWIPISECLDPKDLEMML